MDLIDSDGFIELQNLLGNSLTKLVDQFDQQSDELSAEIALLQSHLLSVNEKPVPDIPLEDHRIRKVLALIHKMKGSAGSLYCLALHHLCNEFREIDVGHPHTLHKHLDNLLLCLNSTRLAYRNKLQRDE